MTTKQRFTLLTVVLSVSLLASLGGWVALAAGWVRAGMSGPVVVGFYMFLAMVVALTTFGVLKSYAEMKGQPFGMAVTAGGPFAGVVMVIACLILAEKARPHKFNFSVEIKPTQKTELAGALELTLGASHRGAPLVGNRASFMDIDDDYADADVGVSLVVRGWRAKEARVRVKKNETVALEAEPEPGFCDATEASRTLGEAHVKLAGRVPSFDAVAEDFVKTSIHGDPPRTDEAYKKSLDYLAEAEALAKVFRSIPDCLDDLRQLERYLDEDYAWIMAALYSRRHEQDDKAALARLSNADVANKLAARVFARRSDDGVRKQADKRDLPDRIRLNQAYRLAMLDPMQHREAIFALATDVGEGAKEWRHDALLGTIVDSRRDQ